MVEICVCGALREHHIDLSWYDGKNVNPYLEHKLVRKIRDHVDKYGHSYLCMEYKQDNLKALEEEVKKREVANNG